MKRLLLLLPVVLLLLLAIPSVVSATPMVRVYEDYMSGADNTTSVYMGHWLSQLITIEDESHSVFSVWLMMERVGDGPGTIVVGLQEVNEAYDPTGEDIASGTFDGSLVTNITSIWCAMTFILPREESLCFNTTYAIVVSAESGDANNCINVYRDYNDATYAGGRMQTTVNGGITWVDVYNDDVVFAVIGRPLLDVNDVKVFQDYYEDGDMLFCINYENSYVPYYPTDDPPSYFTIQLRDTDATTIIAQTTCNAWGWKPAEIYLNADTAAPLDTGEPYMVVLEGVHVAENPSSNYTLTSEDWKGSDLYLLRSWAINLAKELEEYYDVELVIASGEDELLNDQAAVFFLTGMPSLVNLVPNLFASGTFDPSGDYESATGEFDAETTWEAETGATITGAVEDAADIAGVENTQHMAGILLMIGYIALSLVVVRAGGDAVIAALIAIPVIAAGTELRILPFVLIGAISAVAVILLVYRFWWSRA